ncbi:type 1 glutamine amidotransferase domain-containing protein [Flagellimonas aquimarina]|uniref:Type 1 glutamine amidotransferase domain-containing protein n=1 Tax=Flagellimonas aquimarina TaxID=2201895 RepID=A0A316LFM2_9FLAO|nr:type 1 glutamine amidotransferase domain-containing protein [Allomuricauda koreensis]PWL38890.1 type 1 glutamine amidotransferase domain-containing protein [Allomuricauda koreensis]
MFKKYPILKWTLFVLTGLIIVVVSFGWWFMNLLPSTNADVSASKVSDISYLSENIQPIRGKILAVVTSADTMGASGKATGYELTELARAYYVFQANGFEVDVASPLGGEPAVIIDDEDMGIYDYAFLNDSIAQKKTTNTIPMEKIVAEDYEAVFFAGGKGAMFDFPENKYIQSIVRDLYQTDKVIGAVCHGPAALVNVVLDNGRSLIENKEVSGFTNKEELLLIPEAKTVFPFLLEDKLLAQGALFNEGAMYLEQISHDKNLVTGQNPWSTWKMAETMVAQMGHTPKYREITAEENAVNVLDVYEKHGYQKAKDQIDHMYRVEHKPIDRILIAKHSIMAAMQGDLGRFFAIVGLTSKAKSAAKEHQS